MRACRDAFQTLGMNPNKFMCSIESLMKRVQKSGALPHINTVVDLGNAFSLTYQLPMGAHDVDKLEGDIQIRFSTPEDHFLPMGETEMETMPAGGAGLCQRPHRENPPLDLAAERGREDHRGHQPCVLPH